MFIYKCTVCDELALVLAGSLEDLPRDIGYRLNVNEKVYKSYLVEGRLIQIKEEPRPRRELECRKCGFILAFTYDDHHEIIFYFDAVK